ncbi:hypothetical protein NP493_106g06016 [Ridgeia piscesae]|uniref:Nucleotide-diphospho-sugar transferase domain-containing protein n=1 Tax=Ridgeia piscesae TaxID=27915 RepID=A0AAD9P792_RIDPI|nr:hypothetical protein NP493_106g06016 [Ridgeia piscesae]
MGTKSADVTQGMLLVQLVSNTLRRNVIGLTKIFLALTLAFIFCETLFKQPEPANTESFMHAVRRLASPDKVIFLAYADSAFLDMAENFYETSLKPHSINNILFVASDRECCRQMRGRLGLPCYVHREDAQANEHSAYGESGFIRKMNYRTDVILEAIQHGYNVLHTDTDMVYVRHPLKHIHCGSGCDMAILMERGWTHNAGFVYVRPTERGIYLYRQMKNLSIIEPTLDDQRQLNRIVGQMRRSKEVKFNYIRLPSSSFSSGIVYFENGRRTFARDNVSSDIVVIHNNWIVSKEAKIYRFKEHLMWLIDKNGYYSKRTRKYLTYGNPLVFKTRSHTLSQERQALRNAMAIGQILDRVVILPSFHCGENETEKMHCALNSFYRVAAFDATFGDRYREHVFLLNPKVPETVKNSLSDVYRIVSPESKNAIRRDSKKSPTGIKQLRPGSDDGATSVEIEKWLGNIPESVLQFDHLFGAFKGFDSESEQDSFDRMIHSGFVTATYQQKP